jgi:hypothetical protein
MPISLATLEVEIRRIAAGGQTRQKGSWDPISATKSRAWWYTPAIPARQKA